MSHLSHHHHFKPSLNELPKRFVGAMKILFDIMDDQKTGCINIRDIERRWPCNRDSSSSLPSDVMECLRKVTPPNEMINFERFCAGLKMCLLRHRVAHRQALGSAVHRYRGHYVPQLLGQVSEPRGRPSSVPLPDREERTLVRHQPVLKPSSISKSYSGPGRSLDNLAGPVTVRPPSAATARHSKVTPQQRSISVPHLQGKELSKPTADHRRIPSKLRGCRSDIRLAELRGEQELGLHRTFAAKTKPLDQTAETTKACTQIPTREPLSIKVPDVRNQKENVAPTQTEKEADNLDAKQNSSGALRKQARKREPRRHTLGHGIEYSMLRRTKQLEQEKDALVQGLKVVEHARDWYLQRISGVQEKMQNTSKGHAAPEYSTDAHEERLRFQIARIFDVNQHLKALIESSDKGFPLHMNLAVQPPPYEVHQNSLVQRLKEQNHLLTEEVSQKSEVIVQLEREKASLIRELFQARSQHRPHVDETTLM